jgi:predicted O-methyltransferase YrrM
VPALPAELKRATAEVEGWLADEEAEALYDAARACTGRGAIVEIGSFKGKSTICLAVGSKAGKNVPVYAIDTHWGPRFEEFEANVARAGVDDVVRPIAGRSQDVGRDFDEPVELLFIDGAHEYELVLEDFDLWVPKVVDGGIVAMHDTTWTEGPRRVAEERIYRSRTFKDVRFVVGSTTIARKVEQNSGLDRLRSRYSLAVKRAFAAASSVLKRRRSLLPRPVERLGRRILRAIQ